MAEEHALDNLFASSKWQQIDVGRRSGVAALDGVFESTYALVGVVVASDVEHVLKHWSEWQVAMADIPASKDDGSQKDKYLVFVVSEIPGGAQNALHAVLSNTKVCRKICLERHGRSIEETFMDTPFHIRIAGSQSRPEDSFAGGVDGLEGTLLSNKILEDLARRSEDVIVERLLKNEYENGAGPNENPQNYS